MDKPIKCLECYKKRPGGRCSLCPVKNKDQYHELEGGLFMKKHTYEEVKQKLVLYKQPQQDETERF